MTGWLRFFSFNRHTVKHASALLAVTAIISNFLGLFRNLFLYRLYGIGQLDAYFASFLIPDFLFSLLIFGAVPSVVIPFASELITQGKETEAHRLTNQLISWTTLFFIILGLILAGLMPWLAPHFVPGFDPARLRLTVSLSQIMLLQPVFFAPSFVIGALLNAHRRFSSYSFAPLIYNLSIIVGAVLGKRFGVIGVIWFVILGAFLHFAIQYREALLAGFHLRLDFRISPALRQMWILMLPPNLSQGVAKFVPFVYDRLASSLQPGSIAVFSGINNIQTTPTVVVANSLASAFFPSLVSALTERDWERAGALLSKVIRGTLFLLLPTVAMSLILRAQIVRLYVGVGGIDWHLTTTAIHTFAWFMIGVIPASLSIIFARIFYAHKDTQTPMVIGIISSFIGILTSWAGIRLLGMDVSALALAESTIAFCQCILYLLLLDRRELLVLPASQIARSAFNYLIGSILLAATCWLSLQGVDLVYHYAGYLGTARVIGLLVQTAIASLVGVATYLGYSMVRSKEELQWLRRKNFSTPR